jgi:hypothetical protein
MKTRLRWIVAVAALGTGAVCGCEDKQCKADLQTSEAKNQQAQKALEAATAENASLKLKTAKMDELIAKVAALTTENEKLKAPPPAPAPPAKGKH